MADGTKEPTTADVLEKLAGISKEMPFLRFGQLLAFVLFKTEAAYSHIEIDPFYIENQQMISYIEKASVRAKEMKEYAESRKEHL